MPIYEYACERCGRVVNEIYGSLDDAPETIQDHYQIPCEADDGPDPTPCILTRQFPSANFSVRGGTPRHHG